jgi:hypothetical protein
MKFSLDALTQPSLGERWWIAVRTAPVCRERMPLESILSYPVPGKGTLRFFHMMPPASDFGKIRILSCISATVPEIRIVDFRTSSDGCLFDPLPNEFVGRGQTYDPSIETALFDVLPELTQCYLQEQCRTLGRQFRDALELIAGPDLTPYYRSLNAEFFDWLS